MNKPIKSKIGGIFLKEKIFWAGIVLVLLSWIGNYLYFQSKQLNKPIFLEHYYETYVEDSAELTFYYLANKTDTAEVSIVSIDGLEAYPVSTSGFSMWSSSHTPSYVQEYAHHYLKSLTLQLTPSLLSVDTPTKEDWRFNEMTVTFTNGQTITANIGEVHLYHQFPSTDVFDIRSSGGSNHHLHNVLAYITRPVTIEEMTIPFKEVVDDVYMKMNLKQSQLNELEHLINDENAPNWFLSEKNLDWDSFKGIPIQEELFPLALEENDWVEVYTLLNPNRQTFLDFSINIVGTTKDGEPFISTFPFIDHPSLTQQAVNEIIAEKQGGHIDESGLY